MKAKKLYDEIPDVVKIDPKFPIFEISSNCIDFRQFFLSEKYVSDNINKVRREKPGTFRGENKENILTSSIDALLCAREFVSEENIRRIIRDTLYQYIDKVKIYGASFYSVVIVQKRLVKLITENKGTIPLYKLNSNITTFYISYIRVGELLKQRSKENVHPESNKEWKEYIKMTILMGHRKMGGINKAMYEGLLTSPNYISLTKDMIIGRNEFFLFSIRSAKDLLSKFR